MALWVTFWGTRGSIPVSLDSASIRDKLAHAIVAASGKRLDTQEKARAWVDSDLDFAVSHTFGGNSACVQLDAGDDEHVLCDLGSGVRVFGNHVFSRDRPAKGQRLPRVPVPSSLGPNHGLSVFRSCLRTRKQDPDLRLPLQSRRSA